MMGFFLLAMCGHACKITKGHSTFAGGWQLESIAALYLIVLYKAVVSCQGTV